jgi:ABC-type lipoprotein release transport system permease subunit
MRPLLRFLGPIRMRQRWRSCLSIATLLGITLGVSLFAIAGARRTQSSYDRFLRETSSSTMSVGLSTHDFDLAENQQVAALRDVTSSRTYVGFSTAVLVGGKPDFAKSAAEAVGSYDGAYFDQDRFVARHGRVPDPARADEVAVNEIAARLGGFRVGQQIDLAVYAGHEFADPRALQQPVPAGITSVTVVGIGVFPDEILQDEADRSQRMLLTPAFTRSNEANAAYGLQYLRLAHGDDDVESVKAQLHRLHLTGSFEYHFTSIDRQHARRALRPLSITVAVFGILAGIVALALGGLALSRLQRREAEEAALLKAFGAPPLAVTLASVIAVVATILAAAAVAALVAVAMSPLMPLGPVRDVERHRGAEIDVTVIGLGLLAFVLVSVIVVVSTARNERRGTRVDGAGPVRRSTLVSVAASMGASPAITTGMRMAVHAGSGTRRIPMRSVMMGTALAVATLIIAVTFATNMRTLTRTPRLYGWNADAIIVGANGYGNLDPAKTDAILSADHNVVTWSGAYFGDGTIDGHQVPLLGMKAGSELRPPILRGRDARSADEIVLGAETAAGLDKDIGDSLTMIGAPHPLTVVGVATLPTIGRAHLLHVSLGLGAIVSPELVPGADLDLFGQPQSGLGPHVQFLRFANGVDRAAEINRLHRSVLPLTSVAGIDVLPVQRSNEIVNAASLGDAPLLIAALFASLAAVALGLSLAASVQRNSRDLAILRSLGFTGRQLGSAVAWHATIIVLIGLAIGVPLGVIVSTRAWRSFADQLHVLAEPQSPMWFVIAAVALGLLVANAIAVVPARAARRLQVAALLRSSE